MTTEKWSKAYTDFYLARQSIKKLYPSEFLVRTLLGTYPSLNLDKASYKDSKILDGEFDFLLAANSCYYVDPGTTFRANLAECRRVLKPGGVLIATLPKPDSFILEECTPLSEGHVRINRDPYNLRNGYIFRIFRDRTEIKEVFGAQGFSDFSFGECNDDFYGVHVALWLVVCKCEI